MTRVIQIVLVGVETGDGPSSLYTTERELRAQWTTETAENPSKKHGILHSGLPVATASVEMDNYPKGKRFFVNGKNAFRSSWPLHEASAAVALLSSSLTDSRSVGGCLRILGRFSELAGCLRSVVESLETRIGFLDGTLLVSF